MGRIKKILDVSREKVKEICFSAQSCSHRDRPRGDGKDSILHQFVTILVPVLAVLVLSLPITVDAQESAVQILNKIDEVEKYDSAIMDITQVITTSDGDKRTLKMKSWSVNTGEKQLSEYVYPARVKGVRILMLKDGDDIWSYFPRTRRTRHLASHAKKQKMMGSDFTYEDMGGGKMSEKYQGIAKGSETYENVDCFVLELTPTPKGPSYSKIIAWVGKSDYVTRKVDFYTDNPSKPQKTLFLSDIQEVGKHVIARKMLMKNHEDGGETSNEITALEFDMEISDKKFNSSSLDRR